MRMSPEQFDGLVDLIRAIARDEAARVIQAPGDIDNDPDIALAFADAVAGRVLLLFVTEGDAK